MTPGAPDDHFSTLVADLAAAFNGTDEPRPMLSLLWDITDVQRTTLAAELVQHVTRFAPAAPNSAVRQALECFLGADLITDVPTFADLCVAGLRAGRASDQGPRSELVVHHSATSAIFRYFAGQNLRRTPRPGDVALFWNRPDVPSLVEADARLALASSRVLPTAAWYEEWFTLTAPTRFLDPQVRTREAAQFVRLLAGDDPARAEVSRGLVTDWHGTFSSLDETVTNLVGTAD